ncbi:GntR family transcriptional regulator [Mesorhizobium sp. INR15]|uniref:GntR family transcriptional regulator n=1 Tax=Mesorhizobium sp. INR15 TaxID=2654248 RepID=UPI001896663B|nr:GntR family transcriptional regulator [Mesorhizobium sp. INR15]QPC94567.1 GntR family transcriptional regulator [Mesorhizobium sp. INR15]
MRSSIADNSDKQNAGALYKRCAVQIASAIRTGSLEPGLILLEGPVSLAFDTSRATVRKAMSALAEVGLLERFDGRGFMIAGRPAGAPPIKRNLSGRDFILDDAVKPDGKPAADQMIDSVEADIMVAIAFGHYRVDEQQLADVFGVSRPIAREVLWRLRESGLVEKTLHSPWLVGPVTAQAIAQDREVRMLLEPYALNQSAPYLSHSELEVMRETVSDAMATEGKIARHVIESIERDLHISCLRHFDNRRMSHILHGCRLPMIVDALFAQSIGIHRDDATFAEHAEIIDKLLAGEFDTAAARLSTHLRNEGRRTLDRLKVLSILPEPDVAPYLQRIV